MREMELLQQLLELASHNTDLLFKIVPNEEYTNWNVMFTKGGLWWLIAADYEDEEFGDVLIEALDYFDLVTEELIQEQHAVLLQASQKSPVSIGTKEIR